MTAEIKVRIALPQEEDAVMELCRELHSEDGIFDMDEDKVRSMLRRAFNRQGGIIGVIGAPGKLEASIYLLISSLWYSNQPHIEELWNYCRPEYRRSTNAKHLVAFAKRCSDQLGIPLVTGIVSNVRTEAKIRLYRRQLGDPAGAFFLHQSQGAH